MTLYPAQQLSARSLAHILDGIALQGFAILHVLATEAHPAFSYTVGLHALGSTQPELLISGLRVETRVAWLLDLGFRIQGPPPLATRLSIALSQSVPVASLAFPPGGETFSPGTRVEDLADQELPTYFAAVAPGLYEDYLGQAVLFHQTDAFPVLQVVWCDTKGRFPWQWRFEKRFKGKQELLFAPPPLPNNALQSAFRKLRRLGLTVLSRWFS